MSYAESDRALTAMKMDPDLMFLNEVSSVPLQQALRHQYKAFSAFFAGRARYPRFKSRRARQSAHYTRSAFSMRDGVLRLAKTDGPLRLVWSWPAVDVAALDLAMVIVSREPDDRNARQDFLHRASTRLVRGNDVIVIEDLAVRNMVRNCHLTRAISDCGWGEFRRQLEYKCERAGRELAVIDRWYPSSKTCSVCGYLLAELSLNTRRWTCPSCRARHDRDINAAKNILAAGLAVARGSPGDACGADIRHSGSSRVRSAVNQELQSATAGIPVLRGGE